MYFIYKGPNRSHAPNKGIGVSQGLFVLENKNLVQSSLSVLASKLSPGMFPIGLKFLKELFFNRNPLLDTK